MITTTLRFVLACVVVLLLVCAVRPNQTIAQQAQEPDQRHNEKNAVNIHYLEIVTPKVDETCKALEKTHGVAFGQPIAEFGNARMTKLKSGGRIGVRAPMRETEEPVVRPYILVDDIEAAVETVKAAGGEFAILPTEIRGEGKFAIYFLGGIQYGLWQL
jgi:predicted enzyme related to lactoylglutathione lyase